MSMFNNYENIDSKYTPNNSDYCKCNLKPARPNKPYEEYDISGNLIGYWWYYGNTVNLEFNIEGEVTYEGNDSYVSAKEFLKDKQIEIKLFNFRREEIISKIFKDQEDMSTVIFEIDKDLSEELVRGVYYCSLVVLNNDGTYIQTLLDLDNCTLRVK